MAKQLNVNLAFTADTGKAKAQLQDLNRQLERLVGGQGVKNLDLGITKEINEGISAAASLKAHLQEATNVNTGKLDLTKFTQSLQKSNKTLDDYAKNLQKLGPQGSEAFLSLARSIANAEVPLVRVNKKLEEMWTTLKNTARWQISSSILHGFMSSVQSAFRYAENLNESLNNIRIVTGQNIDQMADFAKQANKAAKALSTTTTEYTNASLIYYQQGLSEEEVLERADVTVKMANVANQSAEIVSDQMTAVWNNFYDGSKSLEYYADVMTALGAATASSTDEIAGGLEKFAAIADTIGLSYEYAASALATITSNTRQSEEVVGTALKTIFARIQGLNLGETLEDGVTLNKYSEALNKVGISIFEQNGELKAMDNILNEMGDKWGTLNKDQQTALAQTVAGVRQYNQLISLMDNWDKGDSDSFQANLKTVEKAEGALDEQADIYAESWEAASDRVRAAAEAIYSNLINDDFFIDLLDFGADALTTIDKIMDSLGGMPGILSVISAIILKTFKGKIVDDIEGITNALVGLTDMEGAKAKSQATKKEAYKKAAELATKGTDKSDPLSYGNVRAKHIQDEAMLQDILLDKSNQLNELQLKEFQTRLDGLRVMQEEAELQAKTVEEEKEKTEELVRRQKLLIVGNKKATDEDKKRARENLTRYENLNKGLGAFDKMTYQAAKGDKTYTENDIKKIIDISGNSISGNIKKELHNLIGKTASEAIDDVLEIYTKIEYQAGKAAQNLIDAKGINIEQKNLDEIAKSAQKTGAEINDLTNKTNNLDQMAKDIEGDLNSASASTITWRDTLVQSAEGIVSITGGIIALKGAFNSLSEAMEDGNLSMDEFIGFCTSLSIALPSLISGVKALGAVQITSSAGTLGAAIATSTLGKAITALAAKIGIVLPQAAVVAIVIAGVAAAIAGLVKVIDDNIVTEEEARESIDKANEAYKEQKKIVDELNDTLQTTKDRIDELNNQDTLSPIEQDELNKLQQELAYLERQLEIEKELEKSRQQEQVNEIVDKYATANESLVEGPKKIVKKKNIGEGDGMWEYQSADEWWGDRTEAQKQNPIYKEEYNKWLDEEKQARTEWLNENKDAIQNAEKDYQSIIAAMNAGIEVNPEDLKDLQSTLQFIRKNTFEDGKYFELVIEPIFDSKAFNQQKNDIIKELNEKGTLKEFNFSEDLKDQLELAGISINEFSLQVRNLYRNANNVLKDVQGTPEDFINSLSFEDIQLISESNFDTTEFDEFYRKFLDLKNQRNSIVVNVQMARDTAKDALNTLAQGDFLSEEQLTNLQEHFKDLYDLNNLVNMSMYDQARTISSALLNATIPEAAINNTINKVGELQEQLNALSETKSELTDEEKKLLKIELEAELDQAKKDIETLTSEPINLSVEIDNSLIEGLKAQAGAIDKATSLITEGFKVEAKNVSELMKTMPQLFEDATVDIKTGVVQLQQDIVNSAIETAKAETEVERQGLIERLNARIVYLNGSIDSLNKLRTVAEANSDATKLKEEINSKLTLDEKKASAAAIVKAKIQQSIQEQTQSAKAASHAIQDQQHVTDASKIESETLYQNWQDALEEFNQAAYSAFSNAQAYQNAFTNNQPVGQLALNAKSSITGKSSSSTYQWDYNDGQENKYSNLQAFVDAGFDFSKIEGLDQSNDIAVQVYANQIKEQWKDLFNTDLNGKALWGGAEGFTDQFFGMYETAEALGIDTNLGINDLQYELAEAIAQLSNTASFDGALKKLKESGSGSYKTEIERYHEINRQIEDQKNLLNEIATAKENAYGISKINLMEQEIAEMDKMKSKQNELLAEQQKYLKQDEKALLKLFPSAKFDGNGNISNYNELLMQTTSEEQKKILEQYEETVDAIQGTVEALDDLDNQIKDMNFEKMSYKLELELDLNDAELQEIEFELSLIEDDFYKMAEAASFMKDKIDPLNNSLEDLRDNFDGLTKKYEDGDISQAKYIEGLQNARDGIYDQLNALVDLDKEMMEYYGNTLDAAMEELDKYTDHMEHLTGVIDHYISLMELMGKSTDFEAMDEFLSARAETTKNELDVAKSNYEMLKRNSKADEYYENYQKALTNDDQDMAKWWKTQWEAEIKVLDEAQEEMLSKTEEWMEAMKAVIENNMKKAQKALEESLTGGTDFDTLMTEMDRLNARQEEYLTKTNQIYETNKLMRQAAQAADKTDNAVAKQKFKNFAEETKQLQEKGQLSKYELEIQQAKYDLLLAEIALEDAQNAKSTVRLQRDSEGNFGYVYTADQDKIADAQQAVADAENDLYNISLDGQKDYTEKYTQSLQSMFDEMTALQEAYRAGDIATEEEYQARKEALIQHYFGVPNGILTTYSNLYNIAVQTDANATADFWATSYGNMTANTEDFKTAVNGYLVEVENETETWHEITKEAQKDITEGLDDLVEESEDYADVVEDEVIPALGNELEAVQDLTEEYAEHRKMIQQTIQDYKNLIQQINAAIAAEARQGGSSKSSGTDLSRSAAIAASKGDWDTVDALLDQREYKMATGNHPNAVDNDELRDAFEAAKDKDPEAQELIDRIVNGGNFTKEEISKFDTGGYTGEWGPQAKLAFVHEKEIMLNPDDTVNFLDAIKITRSIMEIIDKQAGWASAGLGFMTASGVSENSQTLEQEVTIHAEFPNATNHSEIEEAFHNLMNTASQYANRKNR